MDYRCARWEGQTRESEVEKKGPANGAFLLHRSELVSCGSLGRRSLWNYRSRGRRLGRRSGNAGLHVVGVDNSLRDVRGGVGIEDDGRLLVAAIEDAVYPCSCA